ncbi:helix-hairpin-helix domain-containing protein [Paenibacillus sp. OV219]|uniref:ComEA family DNA-binding protein n=1 Tax=Paenibacillus sp. OV219 TaxID=1884377 RepID=UPI0008B8A5A4|nr:helix-hairpin-helix domain-containing protein [Paenibacillus sp. OV219]SEN07464.1 competence protein ComEA [Paenibacillus sp. OV219]
MGMKPRSNKIKSQKLLIIVLLVAAVVLVCTALYQPESSGQPGWEAVNNQVERALGAEEAVKEQDQEAEKAASGGAGVGETKNGSGESVRTNVGAGSSAGAGAGAEIGTGASGDTSASRDTSASASASDVGKSENTTKPPPVMDGKVDINHATVEQLDTLPGIGASKAKAIVADREQNGVYHSADDLLRVKGIGPKLLAKLKAFIVLQP